MTADQLDLIRKLLKDCEKPITSAVTKDELMRRVSFNEGLRRAFYTLEKFSNNEIDSEFLDHIRRSVM